MNILFISPWYPLPPDNGAKLRISNLLSALCSRHRVTLIAAHDPAVQPASLQGVLAQCEKVIPVPWLPKPVTGVARWLSFLWPRPAWVYFAPSLKMRQAIVSAMNHSDFDLIITYELSTLAYLPAYARVPVLLEDVELGGYLKEDQASGLLARLRRELFVWKVRRALRATLPRMTGCTVPSAAEKQRLERIVSLPHLHIVPNCLEDARYADIAAHPEPETLIFTGSLTFGANYEAVSYFLEKIYPLIKRELPGVQFRITGRTEGITLPLAEQDPSVTMTGFVEDVRPLIANSWVSVVPLLTGGGTRFKILEALALGTPVVATSKGAEGLALEPGKHFLIEDTPQAFAAAVVQLCRDSAMRARLSEAGRKFVFAEHTWQSVAPRYLAWVEQIAGNTVNQDGGAI